MVGLLLFAAVINLDAKPSRRPASPQWSVSPYRIVTIEQSRLSKGRLERWLFQGPIEQQRRVLLAMSRIGDPAFIEPINALLNRSRNADLRQVAAFALGSIEGDTAFMFISQNIPMHKDDKVVRALLINAGRTGHANAIHFLSHYLKSGFPNLLRSGACLGIGYALTRQGEKAAVNDETFTLLAQAAAQSDLSLPAAFALSRWQGNPNVLPISLLIDAIPSAPSGSARALLIRVIGKGSSPEIRTALIKAFQGMPSLDEKIETIKGLGNQPFDNSEMPVLKVGLQDTSRHVQVTTLDTLRQIGSAASSLTPILDSLLVGSGSEWTRASILSALARLNPEAARSRFQIMLPSSSGLVLESIVGGYATLGTPGDLALTLEFIKSPHVRLSYRALDSLLTVDTTLLTADFPKAARIALQRRDAAITATIADLINRHEWTDLIEPLKSLYSVFSRDDEVEIREAIVRCVGSTLNKAHTPFLESALADPHRPVAEAASKALKTLTGRLYPFPLNSRISAPVPPQRQLFQTLEKHLTFITSRGDFSLRFLKDAPVTAYYFWKDSPTLVGRPFHRIVPNFVVQGGDPRGDGFGGPGYNIRDEISEIDHERGVVGMATAGKDTGGCQFFINLNPNLHLAGRYTAFADVTSGIEVIDRLEPNDTILKVLQK